MNKMNRSEEDVEAYYYEQQQHQSNAQYYDENGQYYDENGQYYEEDYSPDQLQQVYLEEDPSTSSPHVYNVSQTVEQPIQFVEMPIVPERYVVVNKKKLTNTRDSKEATYHVEVFRPGYHIPAYQFSANCVVCLHKYFAKLLVGFSFLPILVTVILWAASREFPTGMFIFTLVYIAVIILLLVLKKRREDRMYIAIFDDKEKANEYVLSKTYTIEVSGRTGHYNSRGKYKVNHFTYTAKKQKAKTLE